jgi:hypothetical protein
MPNSRFSPGLVNDWLSAKRRPAGLPEFPKKPAKTGHFIGFAPSLRQQGRCLPDRLLNRESTPHGEQEVNHTNQIQFKSVQFHSLLIQIPVERLTWDCLLVSRPLQCPRCLETRLSTARARIHRANRVRSGQPRVSFTNMFARIPRAFERAISCQRTPTSLNFAALCKPTRGAKLRETPNAPGSGKGCSWRQR